MTFTVATAEFGFVCDGCAGIIEEGAVVTYDLRAVDRTLCLTCGALEQDARYPVRLITYCVNVLGIRAAQSRQRGDESMFPLVADAVAGWLRYHVGKDECPTEHAGCEPYRVAASYLSTGVLGTVDETL